MLNGPTSTYSINNFHPLVYFNKISTSIINKISAFFINRGGLAFLFGQCVVPAQWICTGKKQSQQIINANINRLQKDCFSKIESFVVQMDDEQSIEGIVIYPKNWTKQDSESKCMVFHNGNPVSIAVFFSEEFQLQKNIALLNPCPLILYDYRGVGLNKNKTNSYATAHTIVEDGTRILEFALQRFGFVHIWGTSLGGGVALCSTEKVLERNPALQSRIISLIHHDSFTTTSRVVLPFFGRISDFFGWLLGAHLNAMEPMKKLIARGLKINILNHTQDRIIPAGARMSEFVSSLPPASNVTLVDSCEVNGWNNHAFISNDFKAQLQF